MKPAESVRCNMAEVIERDRFERESAGMTSGGRPKEAGGATPGSSA
jgi:hypothetical protein